MQLQPTPKIEIPKSNTKGQLKWSWGTARNVYRSFENAKTYVRSLELDSAHSFREFAKMYVKGGPLTNYRLMPTDIPVVPEHVYATPYGDGTTPFDWDDFLGTKKSGRKGKKVRTTVDGRWFFPYEEWKRRVSKGNIKSVTQYLTWRISQDDKVHFPKEPEQVYRNQWEGWSAVVDNDVYMLADRDCSMMPFDQAIKFVHTLNLANADQYDEWYRATRPVGLPLKPEYVYRKDWTGWPKYLGTKLEYRLEVAKLNVDSLIITKVRYHEDLFRIYVDERGYSHAIQNMFEGDTLVETFKYQRDLHPFVVRMINQYCIASAHGQTIVHCRNVHGLVQALNISLEIVRWKEIPAIQYKPTQLPPQQRQFCDQLMIPGRDPIYEQRPYQFDPFDYPDAEYLTMF